MGGVTTRVATRVSTALLGVLLIVGVVATGFVIERAVQAEREDDELAVASVAAQLQATLQSTLSSLTGIDGLGVDGVVEEPEFDSFAGDVMEDSIYTALAYAEIVPGSERDAWEAASGLSIIDTDGAGGFVGAPARDEYIAVRLVWPNTEGARAVRGFDFRSDPVRTEGTSEALVSETPVLVGPIRLATSTSLGLFAVHDVHDASGRAIGFLASGVSVGPLLDRIALPSGVDADRVAIWVDGEQLQPSPIDGPAVTFEVGGRTFLVRADDGSGVAWILPVITGLGTIVLAFALLAGRRRDEAEREREDRVRERTRALADLADALAGADTVDATTRVGLEPAKAVMRSAYANIGLRDRDGPTLTVVHDGSMSPDLDGRFSVQPLDADLPLAECVRTGATIVIADRSEYAMTYPAVVDEVVAAGIESIVCCPITVGQGGVVGAVGYAWSEPLDDREIPDLVQAAAATAQIIGRALERSLTRDEAREQAERLSDFAGALARARNAQHVDTAVRTLLPTLFRAERAELANGQPSPDGDRAFTLPSDPNHTSLRVIGDDVAWDDESNALAHTVVQLVDSAWGRARQHDQEHAVLQRLQTTMLAGAPPLADLDVAVAYQSALDTLGIGGDWYSVIDRPDATYFVIGDIAGHGAAAVAIMAEVKTIIRHLLTGGTPMTEVVQHADACLARRNAYASATIVCVDRFAPRLTYVNAGHPYPIVMGSDGTAIPLARTHRPWLGVVGAHAQPTAHDFGPGDTLVLYTDGMIEQRGTPLSVSIDELATHVSGLSGRTCDELVRELVRHRQATRDDRTVDDDIAVIAATRTA